ncbi:MAG: hypothetical protein IJK84_06145 [Bacteroidales bacterium]|nr:hypothetical protein [Bacteroidales bacterium]
MRETLLDLYTAWCGSFPFLSQKGEGEVWRIRDGLNSVSSRPKSVQRVKKCGTSNRAPEVISPASEVESRGTEY